MKIDCFIKQVSTVSRGPHVKSEETKEINLQEAYVLDYDNIKSGQLIEDMNNKVFVDLYSKYKNAIAQSGDIVIPVFKKTKEPKLICIRNKKSFSNFIYPNDVLIIKANRDRILPEYLFHILNSDDIQKQLTEIISKRDNQNVLQCADIENLKIEIPPIEQQEKLLQEIHELNKSIQEKISKIK